jgi:cell wall-associated NlpC family hydrolase
VKTRPVTVLAVVIFATGAVAGCGSSESKDSPPGNLSGQAAEEVVLTPDAVDPKAVRRANAERPRAKARVVELRGAEQPTIYPNDDDYVSDDYVSPGAPSDEEVRTELREGRAKLARFKQLLDTSAYALTGPRAKVLPNGTAVAPANAPESVKQVIQAGNAIANLPYKWGGGHGVWRDNGYDCSGSVSFALAGAGLLDAPRTSGGFMNYGAPGPGEWITIHAGPGHMYMVVAGLRFDTSGANGGTRWQAEPRGMTGLQVRPLPGL